MSDYYKLDENKNVVPCDFEEWQEFFHDIKKRRIAETTIDGKWISTIMLGIDNRFGDEGPPIIFETMVFQDENGYGDIFERKYSTYEEAMNGHTAAVKWVLDGCKDDE